MYMTWDQDTMCVIMTPSCMTYIVIDMGVVNLVVTFRI